MVTSRRYRRLLIALALAAYAGVFSAFVLLEVPGLGLGHFFYLAIVLLALATGPGVGAAGGLLATALYALGVVLNPDYPPKELVTISAALRCVTYTSMGTLVGWFVREHRRLVERLQILAERDQLTGLPNTRAFEAAITRRLEAGEPFGLLIGDMEDVQQAHDALGRGYADDAVCRVADLLAASIASDAELARVGRNEFAVLVSSRSTEELGRFAARLEGVLRDELLATTFGWSLFPREGVNALSLYRAADERLYARKLIRERQRAAGFTEELNEPVSPRRPSLPLGG
jgi:diguanylate cyclase (GGDEF)-like protein